MYAQNERIVAVPIEAEMKKSYIDYAMSVIVGRALPDIRDGLKPVHRRILYAMKELSLEHNKPYKKSARIVGEVLGKYHPHGDVAVYDSLVRMVQSFSLRYPLVDGQGNFGSVDGDSPAAMRYTEARMAAITRELLIDIEKETVDFVPNFDESLEEPTVLPAALPNLMINGSSGIAVGMATNIPPHNVTEVIDALIYLIDNPDAQIKDLMKKIQGPDFPTAGIICGREGIKKAYETGRSPIKIRAKAVIETQKSGKESIVITEIPYQVNKANVIGVIAGLVQQKKIEGISDIRDESDKDGMRMVIELKRDAVAQVILNLLYKHTQLETTFGIIFLALVDNQPRILNLKQILYYFIEHRKEIITRRTKFELRKAQERAHILEGLKICLDNLDKVIKTIRESKNTPEAKQALMEKFGLSEFQAQAILEMQLQRLTALEREKIENEYLELIKKITILKAILADPKKILAIIKEELEELRKKYGDERRTQIIAQIDDFEIEDLIADEDVVITLSHARYIKRLPVSAYRKQRRGGKGVSGAGMREEDFIEHLFIASTHDYLLVFTDQGKVYWLKVYEIPQGGRASKGKAIVNILQIAQGENVSALIQVKEFTEGRFLVMATRNGVIKKTDLMSYSRPRKGGISAITMRDKDELISCKLTDGEQEIFLATKQGKAIRFSEKDVRDMGRTASGVRGISLAKKDEVIGMELVRKDATLLAVTENGFGKRTGMDEYKVQRRGGKGLINIKTTTTNGLVVGLNAVVDTDELMLITSSGMIVRCPIKEVRTTGRSTQGVRLMRIDSKDKVVAVAGLAAREDDEEIENGEDIAEIA
ncbi:MAG: DNA gyrase subunit A [Candidatus Omnitrophica bacterium]|nr:DNA gyrase subunit A [Candidatus Omnitrophota bacterium]MBU4479678.1 DNA gyrase subunit A [Candidatus Omnitrophota bacterium]MCG2703102.1 DNA gyrase subunit A [Candidatus Omnitrophota bacterium]